MTQIEGRGIETNTKEQRYLKDSYRKTNVEETYRQEEQAQRQIEKEICKAYTERD